MVDKVMRMPMMLSADIIRARDNMNLAIDQLMKENERLKQESRKTRDEIRQEFQNDIELYNEELNHAPVIFSNKEDTSYRVFRERHYKSCGHNNKHDIGITIHLVGTGVGSIITLECPVCHETEDITDVSSW